MSFLLDTDICSAHLKGNHAVWQKALQHGGRLHVSVVTVAELMTWVRRKNAPYRREGELRSFLANTSIIELDFAIAEKYGALAAACFDQGQVPPDMDLLIAATALVRDLTLVTHNVQDFTSVAGLRIQDWMDA